ncbi:MAG: D-tyrosyl-tRNA(Tyr) deacylase [Spirochaetae bacterium HGW-Spirochaetae-5]|nr:MAG: D-tyrosyl-tRNA(Tyr) deacylase [Spirochaetae bacterium HGW-Spirochaetae-5]
MRAIIQRVTSASVAVEGKVVSSIGRGLLILAGFHKEDTDTDSDYIINKSTGLRIFGDADGMMNLSVSDIGGEILVVSQFTYDDFMLRFRKNFPSVKSGVFAADMEVSLVNSGPITIILDSSKIF